MEGVPPGLQDFEADVPGGSIAAIEVTAEVDRGRLDLAASARRHLSKLRLPGSDCQRSSFSPGFAPDAVVNAISPDDLLALLSDLEIQGRSRAMNA